MEADQHSWIAGTGDGGQVAGGSAFYTLPLVVLKVVVLSLLGVGDPLKNQGIGTYVRSHLPASPKKNCGASQSYQFLHCLSQVVLIPDHGHHVLVDG